MSPLLILILSTLQAPNAFSLTTSPIKNAPFSFPSLSSIFSPLKQPSAASIGNPALENALIDAISTTTTTSASRLSNSETILSLINQLEQTPSLSSPAISPQIYGRWKLIHTTNTDTSSPIQRKAVDSSQFDIYQDILARPKTNNAANDDDDEKELVVSQVVTFGEGRELVVDALASTSAYPLDELTERKRSGKILGLNLLGVSLVGDEAKVDPDQKDARIDFVFDEGNFLFGDWKIPYPVPFRSPLFRDAVKGWIDITYLSDRMRISRGNKGTTFVLIKPDN